MRERSYNLPVPHCKALALPISVERATQKPTQYSNIYTPLARHDITYPRNIYRCLCSKLRICRICEILQC